MSERLRRAALVGDDRFTLVTDRDVEWVVTPFAIIRADALHTLPRFDPMIHVTPHTIRRTRERYEDRRGPRLRATDIYLTSKFNRVRLLSTGGVLVGLNADAADAWLTRTIRKAGSSITGPREWSAVRLGRTGAVCFYGRRGNATALVGLVMPVAVGLGLPGTRWTQDTAADVPDPVT